MFKILIWVIIYIILNLTSAYAESEKIEKSKNAFGGSKNEFVE